MNRRSHRGRRHRRCHLLPPALPPPHPQPAAVPPASPHPPRRHTAQQAASSSRPRRTAGPGHERSRDTRLTAAGSAPPRPTHAPPPAPALARRAVRTQRSAWRAQKKQGNAPRAKPPSRRWWAGLRGEKKGVRDRVVVGGQGRARRRCRHGRKRQSQQGDARTPNNDKRGGDKAAADGRGRGCPSQCMRTLRAGMTCRTQEGGGARGTRQPPLTDEVGVWRFGGGGGGGEGGAPWAGRPALGARDGGVERGNLDSARVGVAARPNEARRSPPTHRQRGCPPTQRGKEKKEKKKKGVHTGTLAGPVVETAARWAGWVDARWVGRGGFFCWKRAPHFPRRIGQASHPHPDGCVPVDSVIPLFTGFAPPRRPPIGSCARRGGPTAALTGVCGRAGALGGAPASRGAVVWAPGRITVAAPPAAAGIWARAPGGRR